MPTLVYLEYWKRTPRYRRGRKYKRKIAEISGSRHHTIYTRLPQGAQYFKVTSVANADEPTSFSVELKSPPLVPGTEGFKG